MPSAAFNVWAENVDRARALVEHAEALPNATNDEQTLRSDVLRAGWMLAVGAIDVYFCDAYSDFIAATLISKQRHAPMTLPKFINDDIAVPVSTILAPYAVRANWRWRMAARRLMEKENILSLSVVHTLFNKFFRQGHKLWSDVLDDWIRTAPAGDRLFGITAAQYAALPSANLKREKREASRKHLERRFRNIFQRRHDCIHTCDRPRTSPQPLSRPGTVQNVIRDIRFLVSKFESHANAEFRHFLLGCGLPNNLVTQVGY